MNDSLQWESRLWRRGNWQANWTGWLSQSTQSNEVINNVDVTTRCDKLHSEATCRTCLNLVAWFGWNKWDKLGHICIDFEPALQPQNLLQERKHEKGHFCIWHIIFIRYSYIYTNTPTVSLVQIPLQLSTFLQTSQGDRGHDGQTNNCVSGAIDLWDLEAFTDVPPLD